MDFKNRMRERKGGKRSVNIYIVIDKIGKRRRKNSSTFIQT